MSFPLTCTDVSTIILSSCRFTVNWHSLKFSTFNFNFYMSKLQVNVAGPYHVKSYLRFRSHSIWPWWCFANLILIVNHASLRFQTSYRSWLFIEIMSHPRNVTTSETSRRLPGQKLEFTPIHFAKRNYSGGAAPLVLLYIRGIGNLGEPNWRGWVLPGFPVQP